VRIKGTMLRVLIATALATSFVFAASGVAQASTKRCNVTNTMCLQVNGSTTSWNSAVLTFKMPALTLLACGHAHFTLFDATGTYIWTTGGFCRTNTSAYPREMTAFTLPGPGVCVPYDYYKFQVAWHKTSGWDPAQGGYMAVVNAPW
jgi:hypothetical protein